MTRNHLVFSITIRTNYYRYEYSVFSNTINSFSHILVIKHLEWVIFKLMNLIDRNHNNLLASLLSLFFSCKNIFIAL